MQAWYCTEHKEWVHLEAKTEQTANWEHPHHGVLGALDYIEVVSWGGFGVRPMKNGQWRLYWNIVHSGYSQNDSWGHEAGGWVHTHHRLVRRNKQPVQGTREYVIAMAEDDREIFDDGNYANCGAGSYF